jgi:hypothetical protein
MKKILNKIRKITKDILLGFRIAEENRHKSQWGKF